MVQPPVTTVLCSQFTVGAYLAVVKRGEAERVLGVHIRAEIDELLHHVVCVPAATHRARDAITVSSCLQHSSAKKRKRMMTGATLRQVSETGSVHFINNCVCQRFVSLLLRRDMDRGQPVARRWHVDIRPSVTELLQCCPVALECRG